MAACWSDALYKMRRAIALLMLCAHSISGSSLLAVDSGEVCEPIDGRSLATRQRLDKRRGEEDSKRAAFLSKLKLSQELRVKAIG